MGGLKLGVWYTTLSTLMWSLVHAPPPTLHTSIIWSLLGVNHCLGVPLLPQATSSSGNVLLPSVFTIDAINMQSVRFTCNLPDLCNTLVGYYPKKEFQVLNNIINVSLLQQGFIGCSPVQPQLAVAMNLFNFYTATHGVHLSFSIEVYTRMLCLVYKVSLYLHWLCGWQGFAASLSAKSLWSDCTWVGCIPKHHLKCSAATQWSARPWYTKLAGSQFMPLLPLWGRSYLFTLNIYWVT